MPWHSGSQQQWLCPWQLVLPLAVAPSLPWRCVLWEYLCTSPGGEGTFSWYGWCQRWAHLHQWVSWRGAMHSRTEGRLPPPSRRCWVCVWPQGAQPPSLLVLSCAGGATSPRHLQRRGGLSVGYRHHQMSWIKSERWPWLRAVRAKVPQGLGASTGAVGGAREQWEHMCAFPG